MSVLRTDPLYQNAEVPANTEEVNVEAFSELCLHIQGTATTRSVSFKGSVDGINYASIRGFNLGTLQGANSTTGIDEIWQFPVSGLKKFKATIDSVSGGYITIIANYVG